MKRTIESTNASVLLINDETGEQTTQELTFPVKTTNDFDKAAVKYAKERNLRAFRVSLAETVFTLYECPDDEFFKIAKVTATGKTLEECYLNAKKNSTTAE